MVFAQYTITGKVLNTADNRPLESATVFVNKTNCATKTNQYGNFRIQNVQRDRCELIVSRIGFKTHITTIAVQADIKLAMIGIEEKTNILNEVKITNAKKLGSKYMSMFEREILGVITKINMINNNTYTCLVDLCTLSSCDQESCKFDIAEKLQGRCIGTSRQNNKTLKNKTTSLVEFKKEYFSFTIEDVKGEQNYRIFIHTNGDTLIERKPEHIQRIYKKSSLMNLDVINKNEIRFYFVFKLDDKTD